MARDNVPIVSLTLNEKTDRGAGISIVPANGAEIQCNGDTRGLFLEVTNTNGSDRVLTIREGFGLLAKYGNKQITVPATSGDVLISLESGRFVQTDGKVLLDFAASFTGAVRAFRVPKEA